MADIRKGTFILYAERVMMDNALMLNLEMLSDVILLSEGVGAV